MTERLSGEFNRGYTQALRDMKESLPNIIADLQHHRKRITPKLMDEYMECCISNREQLRESLGGFIRWNKQLDGFEYFPGEE